MLQPARYVLVVGFSNSFVVVAVLGGRKESTGPVGSYLEATWLALDQLKGGKKMRRMIIQFGVSTEEGSRRCIQESSAKYH